MERYHGESSKQGVGQLCEETEGFGFAKGGWSGFAPRPPAGVPNCGTAIPDVADGRAEEPSSISANDRRVKMAARLRRDTAISLRPGRTVESDADGCDSDGWLVADGSIGVPGVTSRLESRIARHSH